ncbi:hypothetical protein [Streptomyces alkaliphilus]|uniref:hypothetical protein n=1 Tax=Streptomyces alkaliphilus TaxID=1472722 RepID=UPI00118041F3|nr:hypothetical protein [Streptomyces alkaliphilus]MQS06661.1 hypothetical protein [Streptomyces alkaliphilus]
MARLFALLAVTALLVSGCVRVHGENAVVPATTPREAAEALARYAAIGNEANPVYDAELNLEIDTGPLGEINQAGHRARSAVHPEGNPRYRPLDFTDARFAIPRQAGWPKFFLADAESGREGDANRWLLVFTRNSIEEEWRASYLAVVPPGEVPELLVDGGGWAEAVPVAGEADRLSGAYAEFLARGSGSADGAPDDASGGGPIVFAEGRHTTGEVERRAEEGTRPEFVVQYRDLEAEAAAHAPVGLRTVDGGALVFFTSHHHEKKTWAEGETPVVDEYVEALMEGAAERSVTSERLSIQAAAVPADGGPVRVLARIAMTVGAKGG